MITPMRHITLICRNEDTAEVLEAVRDFGAVHLQSDQVHNHGLEHLEAELDQTRTVLQRLQAMEAPEGDAPEGDPASLVQRGLRILESGKELQAIDQKLAREEHVWAPFGDVDLSTVRALQKQGLSVQFIRSATAPESLPEGTFWLQAEGGGVLVGPEPVPEVVEVQLPVRSPRVIRSHREHVANILKGQHKALQAMATRADEVEAHAVQLEDELNFRSAHEGMRSEEALAWVTGFLPEEQIPDLEARITEWGAALSHREPTVEDPTPTLLKQSAVVSWIQPVFSFLGVTPGYNEVDVGWSFLIFLSVFSGMIIGDAGYGLLLLAVVGGLNLAKPATRGKFANLLLLMAGATTVWGLLTGNLFGLSGIPAIVPALSATSDPKAIMNVCFLLGASHLTLAHLWNLWRKKTSLQALAELGWIGSTWTMYGVTGQMVLGWESIPAFLMPVFLVSVVLIVLFMTPPKEFKKNWVDHMMLPLSFVNNFVDVVSYVRLYAVGMATFALASSFNTMIFPEGAERNVVVTGIMAVILILGHALNFILAGMGVMVHGIRLNTLEFASHLGLNWSGVPYTPFRRTGQNSESRGQEVSA